MRKKHDTSWGKVADWYDDLLEKDKNTYQTQVVLPNLLRILGLKKGDTVFDVACGQGFFTRAFAAVGAHVVGSDISKELIRRARDISHGIEYHITPAHKLTFAKNASADVVTIVLALQNIENINDVFAEVRRVLVRGGRMVFVINHPLFRVLKHSDWEYDETNGVQYRRIGRYLSGEKIIVDMNPGRQDGKQTVSFNRSLQDIVKLLYKNGFVITRLEEWISHRSSDKGPRQTAEDRARKEIPLFMMIEAK